MENLLRTQQATLQNLETVEKTEIAQKDIARSKTVRQQQTSKTPPPKPEASAAPYRSTSHVLSLALPSSPEKSAKASVNPTTAEDAAGYSFDDTPFNPGVHDHSSATGVEQSIYYGGFGPHSAAAKLSQSSHIYRQNIDLLFSRWTQSLPHEGKTSNSEGSMQNQTASSIEEGRHDDGQEAAFRNFTLNAKRGELCAKLKKLSDNILVTKAEKQRKAQSYEAAIKNLVAGEDDLRRQNDDLDAQSERIDRRLAKWKAGMIEMSDIAFRRLQGELERIALDKANLQEKLTEFEIQRHGLEHQYEIALKADEECLQSLEADQLEAEKVLASLQKERERKISNTPVQETKPIDMGWLNDNASHEESSDEEDEPEPGANEDRATDITQTAGSGPDVQAGHPTSSMADSAHSSDGIDGVPDGAVPSMKDGQPSWTCVRKGWKPPERFYGGTNTLSYVTQLAGQNPIWFKASQDAYNFFLGASTKTFYTISLVPSDLASYETAKICWTVIAKSWATPTALSAAGWPYTEDSVGNVWIHKDLNWVGH